MIERQILYALIDYFIPNGNLVLSYNSALDERFQRLQERMAWSSSADLRKLVEGMDLAQIDDLIANFSDSPLYYPNGIWHYVEVTYPMKDRQLHPLNLERAGDLIRYIIEHSCHACELPKVDCECK